MLVVCFRLHIISVQTVHSSSHWQKRVMWFGHRGSRYISWKKLGDCNCKGWKEYPAQLQWCICKFGVRLPCIQGWLCPFPWNWEVYHYLWNHRKQAKPMPLIHLSYWLGCWCWSAESAHHTQNTNNRFKSSGWPILDRQRASSIELYLPISQVNYNRLLTSLYLVVLLSC